MHQLQGPALPPARSPQAPYADRTGGAAHQRAIDARFKKLDARRQDIIRRVLAGDSYRMIGEHYGITAGSVQSAINSALEAVRKELAGEPGYNQVGRKKVTAG